MSGRAQGSKYSPQTRERVVRLVLEQSDQFRNEFQACAAVAEKFGMHRETVRRWVREARVAAGELPAHPDEKDRQIAELRRENAELAQTVEILKAATSFFARECDPLPPSSASSSPSTGTGSESHRSVER
ncbi:transposase [Nocardioides pakistanensis]